MCVAVVCVTNCITQENEKVGADYRPRSSQMPASFSVLSGNDLRRKKLKSLFQLDVFEPFAQGSPFIPDRTD